MKHERYVAAVLVCICLAWPATGRGQQTQSKPSSPAGSVAIDKDSMAALDKMGAYLRTLKAFQIRATTTRETVLDDGQKIALDGTVDLLVQRPDKLRAEISSDAQHRMFFFDGKTFTIFARRVNYYASVPAPPTLGELAERLATKYDIEVPLADLFYWGIEKSGASDGKSAMDVGPSQVEGVTCEHYAFRQEGLDWQVWLQNGDYPLPRKLIVTTTDDEARPQYTSVLTWNLAPSFDEAAFTFSPPADAHKIVLAEVKAGGGSPDRR
jgi:hypothetical protein